MIHNFSLHFWRGYLHQPKNITTISYYFILTLLKLFFFTLALLMTSALLSKVMQGSSCPQVHTFNQWKRALHNAIKWFVNRAQKMHLFLMDMSERTFGIVFCKFLWSIRGSCQKHVVPLQSCTLGQVSTEHLQRVRLANRGRLLLRTPGPVQFWTCMCVNIKTSLYRICLVSGLSFDLPALFLFFFTFWSLT